MPSTWAFRNVTRSTNFDVAFARLNISDARPCELARLDGAFDDKAGSYDLEVEDEILVTETPDGGSPATVFAGDITNRVRTDKGGGTGPRVYRFTAQDFTGRLEDNVITDARSVTESVSARVAWIMGYSNRGLTFTHVATIATTIDPFDYTGMSVRAGLAQVAALIGAILYVDDGKDLHFFVTESNPAPFDLVRPSATSGNPPYRDFVLNDATPRLAHAVFVKGDGVALWRTAVGAPTNNTRQERAVVDNNIKTVADADAAGDAILAKWSDPALTGSYSVRKPGLKGGMQQRIANPAWAVDATFVITRVTTTLIGPRLGQYAVEFAQHYLCSPTDASFATAAVTLPVQVKSEVTAVIIDLSIAGANQIRNSSFEQSSDWTVGSLWTMGYASANPYHGTETARCAPSGTDAAELVTTAFIPVDRTADWWVSFWSYLSARTSGTARAQLREYNSSGTLLASTSMNIAAAEPGWTRHSGHLGPTTTDTRLAFQATTVKVKVAFYTTGSAHLTWEIDALQLENSAVLTSYAPAPYELADASVSTATLADLAVTLGKMAALSVDTTKLVDASITAAKIAAAAVTTAAFAAGIRPVAVVGALPANPYTGYLQNDVVVLTSDHKLYRLTNTAASGTTGWSRAVDGTDLSAASLPISAFPAGLRPVTIVGALPSLPDTTYPDGAPVMLTTDHKLYRNVSGTWTKSTDGADLVAGSVTAAAIAADTITAAQIAAGAISTSELAANAVTAATIATGTITANEIAADTITAGQIAAGAISTSELAANAVTAAKIAAGTITATELAANSVTATQIAANAVTANAIAAGAINTTKLAAGFQQFLSNPDPLNALKNPSFESGDTLWAKGAGATIVNNAANAHGGNYYLEQANAAGVTIVTYPADESGVTTYFEIQPGAVIYGGGYVNRALGAGNCVVALELTDKDKANPTVVTSAGATSGYSLLAGAVTVPAGKKYVRVFCYNDGSGGTTTVARFDDLFLTVQIPGGGIVASSITAAQIAANAITATQINASAVTAGKIAANAVVAGNIAANAVTAATIAAGAITADKLLVGAYSNAAITNPFFVGLAGWGLYTDDGGATLTSITDTGASGGHAGQLHRSAAGSVATAQQTTGFFPVTPGQPMTVSLAARKISGSPGTGNLVWILEYTAAGGFIGSVFPTVVGTIGSTYSYLKAVYTPSSTCYTAALWISNWTASSDLGITDIRIETASILNAANGNTLIDNGGVTVTGGAITVKNAGGTVIIDGTSDIFKIAATGTQSLTGPNGSGSGGGSASVGVTIATGLTVRPAHIGFMLVGSFAYPLTYTLFDNSNGYPSSGLVTDVWTQTTTVSGGSSTDVEERWATRLNRTASTYSFRYYILAEAAI